MKKAAYLRRPRKKDAGLLPQAEKGIALSPVMVTTWLLLLTTGTYVAAT